ncbi:MAG: helix-turn-helix transcriptional regulator [Anaerolineaceae bacterium]|nr:helix-turn-helix transcriptional regulator [Anaerolineaceae bacterium]
MIKDWITQKYIAYRGDAIGNEKSISDFARYLEVSQSLLSEWMAGKKKPGIKSIDKIAKKYPEIYDVMGLHQPSQDELLGLPKSLRTRLRAALAEMHAEYNARSLLLDDPEAEKIAIEILEKHGFKYTRTSNSGESFVIGSGIIVDSKQS